MLLQLLQDHPRRDRITWKLVAMPLRQGLNVEGAGITLPRGDSIQRDGPACSGANKARVKESVETSRPWLVLERILKTRDVYSNSSRGVIYRSRKCEALEVVTKAQIQRRR
jgi:hypothetical protein